MSRISKPNFSNRLRTSVQQYSQRSELEKGQDQRHDDVVISGMLLYMSEPKVVPYDKSRSNRHFKVVLDSQSVQEIVRRWGPGGKDTQTRKMWLTFNTTVTGDSFPVIYCHWTKGSRIKIAKAFPVGGCQLVEAQLPLMSGLAYQFEAPANCGIGIKIGEFVRMVGIYACSSFSDKTAPDYRRFVNLNARTVVSLGPMDPVLTMHIMTAQGITTSTVPEYRKDRAEADWVGPQQVISPHINDPYDQTEMCMIMGMDNFDFTRRRIDHDDNSIYTKWGDRETQLVLGEVMCADEDRRGRNMRSLTSGEIVTGGFGDLSTTPLSMDSCGMTLPGYIAYKYPHQNEKGQDVVDNYTITFTQAGIEGVITLPSSQSVSLGKERVVPIAAIHFRAYPKILEPLGIASLENWRYFAEYLAMLDFIMPSWINTKLSDKLPVNWNDQTKEAADISDDPAEYDEDVVSWDMSKEPESTKGKEKAEEEEDIAPVVSPVMMNDIKCRVYTGYSVTPHFIVADTRGFFSRGIPVTKQTCIRVYDRCHWFLQLRADDIAKDITPADGAASGGSRGAAKSGGRTAAIKKTSKKIMNEFAWHTEQSSLMTHGLICVNEGTGGTTRILEEEGRWKNMVKTATVFPVLNDPASDDLFDIFKQFTPEMGDEYVEFVAGPLLKPDENGAYVEDWNDEKSESILLAHRKTFVERWEQQPDKYAPLIDLVQFLGGPQPMYTPPIVPLTTIVFKTNAKWRKGREAALRYYGPKSIGEEEEEVIPVAITPTHTNGTPPAERRATTPEDPAEEPEDPIEDDDGDTLVPTQQEPMEEEPVEMPAPRKGRRGKRAAPRKESAKQKTPAKKRSRNKRAAS